jgi:hypothetical protein
VQMRLNAIFMLGVQSYLCEYGTRSEDFRHTSEDPAHGEPW